MDYCLHRALALAFANAASAEPGNESAASRPRAVKKLLGLNGL